MFDQRSPEPIKELRADELRIDVSLVERLIAAVPAVGGAADRPRRGWALWKSLITRAGNLDGDPEADALPRHVVEQVLADHAGGERLAGAS